MKQSSWREKLLPRSNVSSDRETNNEVKKLSPIPHSCPYIDGVDKKSCLPSPQGNKQTEFTLSIQYTKISLCFYECVCLCMCVCVCVSVCLCLCVFVCVCVWVSEGMCLCESMNVCFKPKYIHIVVGKKTATTASTHPLTL